MSITRRAFMGAIAAGVALGLTPKVRDDRIPLGPPDHDRLRNHSWGPYMVTVSRDELLAGVAFPKKDPAEPDFWPRPVPLGGHTPGDEEGIRWVVWPATFTWTEQELVF